MSVAEINNWGTIIAIFLIAIISLYIASRRIFPRAKKHPSQTVATGALHKNSDKDRISKERHNRIEKFLANSFLILISCAVILLAIEFAYRQINFAENPFKNIAKVRDLRVPKPYVTFGGVPNAGNLNKLGYPGPAPSIAKGSGEVRIVVIGGSTVMLGPPTITELIQKKLRDLGFTKAKVYNFGTAGSNATQDYARLVFEVADFKPDIIIFYNGGNDILSRRPDNRLGYPYNFVLWEANPIIEPSLDSYPTFTLLLFGSAFMRTTFPDFFVERFLASAYRNGTKPLEDSNPEFAEIIAQHYVEVSAKSAMFSRMIGAEPIIMFQPILHYKKNKSGWEARNSLTDSHFLKQIKNFRKHTVLLLKKIADKNAFRAVNLTGAFDTKKIKKPVFTDFIHLTRYGNEHMALLITDHITKAFPQFFRASSTLK